MSQQQPPPSNTSGGRLLTNLLTSTHIPNPLWPKHHEWLKFSHYICLVNSLGIVSLFLARSLVSLLPPKQTLLYVILKPYTHRQYHILEGNALLRPIISGTVLYSPIWGLSVAGAVAVVAALCIAIYIGIVWSCGVLHSQLPRLSATQ